MSTEQELNMNNEPHNLFKNEFNHETTYFLNTPRNGFNNVVIKNEPVVIKDESVIGLDDNFWNFNEDIEIKMENIDNKYEICDSKEKLFLKIEDNKMCEHEEETHENVRNDEQTAVFTTDKDYKKAWALLRDAFRHAIKKQKEMKSSQSSVPSKKRKYEDEMSFLLPYFKDRPTISTIPLYNENEGSGAEENSIDAGNERRAGSSESVMRESYPVSQLTNISEATVVQPSTAENVHSISGSREKDTPVRKRFKSSKTQPSSETPSTTLMKYILENKNKTNDVQQFFDSLATTVQSFPSRDRAIAKAKIFAVVSQMEIEILSRASSTSSEYIRSPASCETQMSRHPNYFCSTPSPHASSGLFAVNESTLREYTIIPDMEAIQTLQDNIQNI